LAGIPLNPLKTKHNKKRESMGNEDEGNRTVHRGVEERELIVKDLFQ